MSETYNLFTKWLRTILVPFGIRRKLIKAPPVADAECIVVNEKTFSRDPAQEYRELEYSYMAKVLLINEDNEFEGVTELECCYDHVEAYSAAASRFCGRTVQRADRLETRDEANERMESLITPDAVVQLERKKIVFEKLQSISRSAFRDDYVLEQAQHLLRVKPGLCDLLLFENGIRAAKNLIAHTAIKHPKRKFAEFKPIHVNLPPSPADDESTSTPNDE